MIPLSLLSIATFHAMFFYFAVSMNQKAQHAKGSCGLTSDRLRLA